MIRRHLLFLFLFAIAIVKSADQASDVITLTSDNFDDEVAKNSVFLVEFFAPWCGHCKNLAPEYEKAATELKKEGIHIGAVDADAENNRPLAGRYGIRGFPTLKLFRNGETTDYEGPRTAEGIVSFMKKQTQPSVTELKSVDETTTFSTSEAVVIIGFFDSVESEEYASFVQTAEALRNTHTFGAVVGQSDVNEKFGVTKTPALILFKKFDEGKSVYSGDWQNLKAWVGSESLPLIDEIGGHNYKNYVETGTPLGYLFVNLPEKDEYLNILRPLAQKSKGKINWVYIDWAKFARHAERLGLSGTTVPSIAIENTVNGLHYAFDETVDLTTEGLTAWVDQFLASSLAPTIKSEAVPEDNSGPVTVVVAKNFEQVVLDDTKDVFVKFYAPWCGHCKAMAPTFEELGQAFQDVNNVVIAKMDATANDVDQSFGIQGFPTLLLFPRGNKSQPVRYEGDRSLEDMKTFVQQHNSAEAHDNAKDEL